MNETSDLARLSDHIGRRFEALSPQLKKAARHLLEHPHDVALRSMRELSAAATLPPATFVRLSRALGFAGYAELREVFQSGLRESGEAQRYSIKARDLQHRGDDLSGPMALLKELFGADMSNIERTFAEAQPKALTAALDLIENADRLYVIGQRSCYPAAFLFHYVYRLFRGNAILLDNHGGTAVDELRHIGPDNILIVISVAPYTADVVKTALRARDQGAQLLAITDDRLSPIARGADRVLLVSATTPSFFHSMTAVVAMVQALLALLVMRGGNAALEEIETAERQLTRYRAYWPDTSDPGNTQ
ncbi:MAG: MurR/RpiR family transcriptional regulator [Salinisphaera sp.]|nr:MurR/RpiR family transcriptional regulator [Salinisphaera sp.]